VIRSTGEQQWTGVVQQRNADVLQRAVPVGLPGAGRVLRERRLAEQRPGVLPGVPGPAGPVAGQRPGGPVLSAVPGPFRRGVRVRGHVAPGGLLQEERGQGEHVPGGRDHGRPGHVRAVRLPVAHPVGAIVQRGGRGRAAGRQGPGRVQRGRRAHTRAPRVRERSDTQPRQVSNPRVQNSAA